MEAVGIYLPENRNGQTSLHFKAFLWRVFLNFFYLVFMEHIFYQQLKIHVNEETCCWINLTVQKKGFYNVEPKAIKQPQIIILQSHIF